MSTHRVTPPWRMTAMALLTLVLAGLVLHDHLVPAVDMPEIIEPTAAKKPIVGGGNAQLQPAAAATEERDIGVVRDPFQANATAAAATNETPGSGADDVDHTPEPPEVIGTADLQAGPHLLLEYLGRGYVAQHGQRVADWRLVWKDRAHPRLVNVKDGSTLPLKLPKRAPISGVDTTHD